MAIKKYRSDQTIGNTILGGVIFGFIQSYHGVSTFFIVPNACGSSETVTKIAKERIYAIMEFIHKTKN
jgi:vacuolar-type H+-ATPase catalytic subunit A/Vma1